MNERLEPYYYLNNFQFLIEWVEQRYQDLLSHEERFFISKFAGLDEPSQCLLVRMIGRKGPWYRASKLEYTEIDNHNHCADQLIAAGFITTDSLLDVNELAAVLTKPELLLLFNRDLSTFKSAPKAALIDILNRHPTSNQTWEQWTHHRFGRLYRLDSHAIVSTFLLLFFGNPYQDLKEFVLQDLGLYRYEQYAIDPHHRLFKKREEVLQYQNLVSLRERLADITDVELLSELAAQIPASFENPIMERRRARLLNAVAYRLERQGNYPLALALYQQSNLPPAKERQIRLLEKTNQYQQAWDLLSTTLHHPMNEQELQVAHRIAPRLARKLDINFSKNSVSVVPVKEWILPQLADERGNFLKVEEIVRQHLASNTPCFFVENQLINSLFGLWLWPEMFRSLDGVFANPFQTGPLDLYQPDFQSNRPGLQRLWTILDDNQHKSHIYALWLEKKGIANQFVNWNWLNEDILHLALDCIPAHHLKLIFQRLLFDLEANRSGLPDLIQFFPASNSYRMLEVKGPGDRIQDNQQRWLEYFIKHNIPAEVCYVTWQ